MPLAALQHFKRLIFGQLTAYMTCLLCWLLENIKQKQYVMMFIACLEYRLAKIVHCPLI